MTFLEPQLEALSIGIDMLRTAFGCDVVLQRTETGACKHVRDTALPMLPAGMYFCVAYWQPLPLSLVFLALPLRTLPLLHHPEALFIPSHILRNGSCIV